MKPILIATLLLVSCGDYRQKIDSQLYPYVEIVANCGVEVDAIDVKFGGTYGTVQGYCEVVDYGFGETKKVVLNPTKWDRLDENEKIALMFHEILHCSKDLRDLYNPADELDWMFWQGVGPSLTAQAWEANSKKYCKGRVDVRG